MIPSGPSSRASVFAQPMTPGLTALESARLSIGSRTELDATLTIRPRPLFSRYGTQSDVRRTTDTSRSWTVASMFSASSAIAAVRGGPPELLTRMSMPPNLSTADSTSRFRSPGTVTSPATASPPRRSASRSSGSGRLANSTTFAPSSASASAIPRPIPADAPQMTAVRPCKWRSTLSTSSYPGPRPPLAPRQRRCGTSSARRRSA